MLPKHIFINEARLQQILRQNINVCAPIYAPMCAPIPICAPKCAPIYAPMCAQIPICAPK